MGQAIFIARLNFKTMVLTKVLFALLIFSGGPDSDCTVAEASGLRPRTLEEKKANAIAGLRELVKTDEYDALAFLNAVGIHEVSASWNCGCGEESRGNKRTDEVTSLREDATEENAPVCECQCKEEGALLNKDDGWDLLIGNDGQGVTCHFEVRTESVNRRNLATHGVVARRVRPAKGTVSLE